MHPKSIFGVEDLTELEDVHEAAILRSLLMRYRNNDIYTYCGDILIALNPFKTVDIYNRHFVDCYRHYRIGELEPHVYALAEHTMTSLVNGVRNQNVIISGESGSGKTETGKLLTHYLSSVAANKSKIEGLLAHSNLVFEGKHSKMTRFHLKKFFNFSFWKCQNHLQ